MKLKFIIPGIPQAKQSARFRIAGQGNKRFIMSYQKKEVKDEERSIKLIIKEQLPAGFQMLTCGVRITKLHYIFPPLKTFNKKIMWQLQQGQIVPKTTKPDLSDNLNKGLFDAMQGIVFANDSQVYEMDNLRKYYGLEPRTEVEIEFNDASDLRLAI